MSTSRPVSPFDARWDPGAALPPGVPAVLILVVLACLLPTGAGAGAEVFKWSDDEGKIHYGDRPPYEGDVETVRTPPPPSDSAVLQSRSRLDHLRSEVYESEKVRENEKKTAAREREARERRCLEARYQLRVAEFEGPVFRGDERGERVYLADDARAAKREHAQKLIEVNCR